MKRRTLIALSVAAAFALPLSAQAGGDKAKSADTGAAPSASQGASSSGIQALDKNKDGSLSRDEAKGTPHEKNFATLDKNRDGKLTPEEMAAAPAPANEKAATGGTSSKPKY